MKNKKIKKTYCKECGGHLDKHTRICQNCGKRYFKFRVIHLLNILSCLLIVFLSVTCIGIYDMYQDALQDKKDFSDENTEVEFRSNSTTTKLTPEARKQAQQSLKDREYNVTKSATDNENLSNQVKELESKISDLEEKNKQQANKILDLELEAENNAGSQRSNSIYNNNSKNNTCIIPSCENDANRNSFYCRSHECTKSSCHKKRANDLCLYCEAHKCHVPDCNSSVSSNSNYCYYHSR